MIIYKNEVWVFIIYRVFVSWVKYKRINWQIVTYVVHWVAKSQTRLSDWTELNMFFKKLKKKTNS